MVFEINLQQLAKDYVMNYIQWLSTNNIILPNNETYYLLDYTLNTIYEIPCSWYTESIINYGAYCVNYMSKCLLPALELNYEARISLVTLVHSYYVATIDNF